MQIFTASDLFQPDNDKFSIRNKWNILNEDIKQTFQIYSFKKAINTQE